MRRALVRLAADRHGDHRPSCPILDDLEEEPASVAKVERLRP